MVDLIRFGQVLDDRLRDFRHIAAIARVADHDGEFVTPKAAAHLVLGHQGIQALGDFGQHPVTDQMAERIVDRLEPVEIDHQEGATGTPLFRIPQRRAQGLGEHQAVGERGQGVVAREIGDLCGGFLLLGDIRAHAAETRIAPVRRGDRSA